MTRVYIAENSVSYHEMFQGFGMTVVASPASADLFCFTGGADVTPSYYGHKAHHTTFNNEDRDRRESILFKEAISRGIPMVGICRGGQFLNVMSGGEMYQDVSKHVMGHDIVDLITGETVYVSSTHHQMMKPSPRGLLVASSRVGGSREWYENEVFKREVSEEDIEVVWYEETKCLCFQPHPEFNGGQYVGMRAYFRSLLQRYIEV